MRYKLSTYVLIGLGALWLTSCSTSRKATSEVSSSSTSEASKLERRSQDTRDTVREQVVVAVHDTVMETKTITITQNEAGDTTFTSIVTDRTRASTHDRVREKEEKLLVRTDTVYVAIRDSVSSSNTNLAFPSAADRWFTNPTKQKNSFVSSLKWICFIILGLIALIITVKVSLRRLF